MKPPTFTIKKGSKTKPNSTRDLQMLTPKMLVAFGYFAMFCQSKNLPVELTNITNRFKQSKSNTHPEGRAIDVSVRNWRIDDIEMARDYMEKIAGHLGAVSGATGERKVFVYHDAGLGKHIHLQVSR